MDEALRQQIIGFYSNLDDEELALSYELTLAYIIKVDGHTAEGIELPSSEDEPPSTLPSLEEPSYAGKAKNTPAEETALDKSRECPFCKHISVVKHGHKDGKQRFRCKSCHRTITYRTNTIMPVPGFAWDSKSQFPAAR